MLVLALLAGLACGDTAQVRRIAVTPSETLAVTIAGASDDRPVVLIPGLLGSAFGFRKVTRALVAAGRRAIVVEPLGFGESSRPSTADYSLDAQADRVDAVLDTLGVRGAVIVAHNLAASIAMRLALRHPDRAAALLSLDGGPVDRPSTPGVGTALHLAPLLAMFGAKRIAMHKVRDALRSHSADPSWVTNDVVAAYARPLIKDLRGVLRAMKRMSDAPTEPLATDLPRLRVPLRVLVGRSNREGGIEPQEVALLESAVADFAIDTVDHSGIYLQEERPDAVVAAVLALSDPPVYAIQLADARCAPPL